jgi:hypothetical protein
VSDSDLVRASGLWLKDRKGGGKFMSGEVREAIPEGAKLLVFKNDRKESGKRRGRHPRSMIRTFPFKARKRWKS